MITFQQRLFQSFIYAKFGLLVMTRYSGYSKYVAPSCLEEWLEKKGTSQTFATVFTWSKADILSNHEGQKKKLEIIIERIEALTAEFQALHKSRISYMEEHGFDDWHQLDSVRDAEHLAIKDSLFSSVETSVTEAKMLKKERAGIEASIPLLAGILVGSYTSFSSLIDAERKKHGEYPCIRRTNSLKKHSFKFRSSENSQFSTHV